MSMSKPKTQMGTRRQLIEGALFGAGALGLRALATGLPAWMFARPVRSWAAEASAYACAEADRARAQYLIVATSSAGDPVNANVPGCYAFPDIVHAADPSMAPTPIDLGGKQVTGAQIWSTLPAAVLARTCFFHHATLTNNHPNLPKVMRLMGATYKQEMLPSILAKHLAPCFSTVQTEPVSVGAGEILTFEGRGLPNLPPTGLRDVLTKPTGALFQLQGLRDKYLDRMYGALKTGGTSAQRQYLDRLAISRNQARSIGDELLGNLGAITSDRGDGPILAAATLIKMNVSPVVAIRIDFGGDNHADDGLAREVEQHTTGVQLIARLMDSLNSYGLQDRVTFALTNVFGRTLKKLGLRGRDHWASHHVSVLIGKGVRGGVVGGVEPKAGDYYCTAIDSATGSSAAAGDIAFADTLGAMGKTLGAAVGVAPASLDVEINRGKVVRGALV
jgi:hypothetical protein